MVTNNDTCVSGFSSISTEDCRESMGETFAEMNSTGPRPNRPEENNFNNIDSSHVSLQQTLSIGLFGNNSNILVLLYNWIGQHQLEINFTCKHMQIGVVYTVL